MGRVPVVVASVLLALSGFVGLAPSGGAADEPWVCGAYDQSAEAGREPTPDGDGKTYPIVFIHGITGDDTAWTSDLDQSDNPFTELKPPRSFAEQLAGIDGERGTGFPGVEHANVYTFSYTDDSLRWVDDDRVGGKFAETIDCLYQRHGVPVSVIAHSMGGLVTRWVANTDDPEGKPRSEKLGKVITIGTPFEGSVLAAVSNVGVDTASSSASPTGRMLKLLANACGDIGTETGDANCGIVPMMGSLRSEAGKNLIFKSAALEALQPWPIGVDVSTVAGSMLLPVGLFEATFSGDSGLDIGDAVVTQDSATADPGPERVQTCDYGRDATFLEKLSQVKRGGDRLKRLSNMTVATACYHGNLTKNVEVGVFSLGLLSDWVGAQSSSISDLDLANSTLPPGSCRSGSSWPNDVAIPLTDGEGEAENSDGSWASVIDFSVVGYADLDSDGSEDALLSAECTGGKLDQCCAGTTSHLIIGLAVRRDASGLALIGEPIWPSERGGSTVTTDSLELDGSTVVINERYGFPDEADCCRTGERETRWNLVEGQWQMDDSRSGSTNDGRVITSDSFDRVSVGDDAAEAKAALIDLLGPPERVSEAPTECMNIEPVPSEMVAWPGMSIISIDEGSGVRVYSISVDSLGEVDAITEAGLRVGSSEAELLELYPGAADAVADYPTLDGVIYTLEGPLVAFVSEGEVTSLSIDPVLCT